MVKNDLQNLVDCAKSASFSEGFEERVMQRIQNETWHNSLTIVFRPLGIAAAFAIVTILVWQIGIAGADSFRDLIGAPEMTIENIAYWGK